MVIRKSISLPLVRWASKNKEASVRIMIHCKSANYLLGSAALGLRKLKSLLPESLLYSFRDVFFPNFENYINEEVKCEVVSWKAFGFSRKNKNNYDTHSSKITLLVVLILWWQISIFGFDISFPRTCRDGQQHSVIRVACNLTFSKTLSVLWPTEILGLQQWYTCRPP